MPSDSARNIPVTSVASLRATLRFHAASGARVALRNSVLGTMGAVFVLGSAPRPPGLFRPLSLGVAGAETSPWSLALVAMVGLALARQAAPQLSAGHAGWMRSLPADRRDTPARVGQRRWSWRRRRCSYSSPVPASSC